MNLKTFLFLIAVFTQITVSQAQIDGVAHEIGTSISGNLDFNLYYKKGTSKSLFRLKTLLFGGQNIMDKNGQTNINRDSYVFGLRLGYERRAKIIKSLNFVYGFDVGLDYNGILENNVDGTTTITHNRHSIIPGINLVLGFNYIVKDVWVFSLEIGPHFQYSFNFIDTDTGITKESKVTHTANYGVNLQSVQVGVAYRFVGKKKEKKQASKKES